MRFIAKLLSFVLMLAMCVSALGRTVDSFPAVYNVTGIRSEISSSDYVVMTRYGAEKDGERELVRVPQFGELISALSAPAGFIISLGVLTMLLLLSKKEKPPRQEEASREAAYYSENQ